MRPPSATVKKSPLILGQRSPPVIDILLMCHNTPLLDGLGTEKYFQISSVIKYFRIKYYLKLLFRDYTVRIQNITVYLSKWVINQS